MQTRWVPDKREGICDIIAVLNKEGTIILRGESTVSEARNEIINTLSNHDIQFIDSIIILPDTTKNSPWGLVTLSVINLRKHADHRSELVSQAILGTPVRVLKSDDSWVLVQTPDKYIAWTEKSSLVLMNSVEMNSWRQSERVIFTGNTGVIYDSPSFSSIVGDLVAGSVMERLGEVSAYTKVILPDGREGFVESKLVLDFQSWKEQTNCSGEEVVGEAVTFLGLPYLWGGSSSKAVDCSGFVQSVFFMNGIILARDASLQEQHGIAIDFSDGFSDLRRGDLLFFGSNDSEGSHVSHVAIYMGDNEYIHSSGRVMINSLDSNRSDYNSYRRNSLLSVKRIVGVSNDDGIVPVNKHSWY